MPRTARVLWVALFALALARLGFAFIHDMYGWGLDAQRFLAPFWAWVPWALVVLALIPALARRGAGPLAAGGDALARGAPVALAIAFLGTAALVYAFPDHVRFVGDFLLRQGTVEERASVGTLFPQALPLDAWLHYRLPLWLSQAGMAGANTAARWIGALEAGLLALCAAGFVRTLRLTGGAAAAAFSIVLFGGYLGLYTGYSKAFVELVVLFAATGTFALAAIGAANPPRARAVPDGGVKSRVKRGPTNAAVRSAGGGPPAGAGALLGAGSCVALALTLHRTAPALLPALALAWFLWWRGRGRAPLRSPLVWFALLVPLATLAAMGPRIVTTVIGTDTVHFLPAEVRAAGGPLRAAFAGTRLVDLLNLILLLSPLALAIPFMAVARGRIAWRRETVFLVVLAAPCVLLWPFIHPVGGIARDWDDFTFGAVALSMLAAWLAADALREAGAGAPAPAPGGRKKRRAGGAFRPPAPHAWLGVAVVASVAMPALQWLALRADLDRGIVRVEALTRESPRRADAERARMFDYLGTINFQQERWRASARAFEDAAALAPSPRLIQQWALAETRAGDFHRAQRVYWRLLAKDSLNASAWLGLATVSSRFGDIAESRRAALRTLALQPGQGTAVALLRYLDDLPGAVRDSLERRYPPRR